MKKINISKKYLYKEYIINNKSTYQLGKEINCSFVTIYNYLKLHEIKIRTKSEARKGKFKGKNHSRFKDGRCSKQHKCIDCNQNINYNTWYYGQGRCYSCANKKKWQDKKFRNKQIKAVFEACNLSPNKPETLLIKLLNKLLPKTYKFVGDGKLIVNGFCPDFVNKDNNKIIEHYGNYWHNLSNYKERDKRRLIAYNEQGYKTLIIWEKELKDLAKVKNRILEFNNE